MNKARRRRSARMCLEDGMYRFRSHKTILATGGYGRAYFSATSAHTCTETGTPWPSEPVYHCKTWSLFNFIRLIYGSRCLITEGSEAKVAFYVNSEGERFMERYAPSRRI